MGHSHAKILGESDKLFLTADGCFSARKVMAARTGAFLKAYDSTGPKPLDSPAYLSEGSYVEKGAMMPSSMGGLFLSLGCEQIEGSRFYRPCLAHSSK
jgi:hypothetical protein